MEDNIFSIEKIVMVDDAFINKSFTLEEIPEDIVTAIFSNEIEDFLDDEENQSKSLGEFFEEKEISQQKQDLFFSYLHREYKSIESFFKDISIEKLHPKEFNSEKVDQYKKLDKSILFIIDKKLSSNNYKATLRNILEKVEPLLKNKKNCFLFLYSSEAESFENYNRFQSYLSDELKLSESSIKTLSMHMNFVNKNEDLKTSMISTAIRKSQNANYLYSFYSIQKQAMDSMNEKIWDINNNELLVHYNYLSEGQHIDEILYDIYKSKFMRQFENYRIENYNSLVKPMRESIHSYVSTYNKDMDYYSVKSRIIKELNNEFQRTKNILSVNESDDISYGDIIKIDDAFFLVLSQQCDITIREDGSRANNEIFLLEIEKNVVVLDAKNIDEKINKIIKHYNMKRQDILPLYSETEFVNLIHSAEIMEELKQKCIKTKHQIIETSHRNSYEYFKYKKNAGAYYIDSFILDCLLIPKVDGAINVNKENINSDKSIRYSTKKCLMGKFEFFIKELEDLNNKVKDEDILGKFIFPRLRIQLLKSEESALLGAKLMNITRIGRLDIVTANEIHQEYSMHSLRVARNEAPIL